MALRVCFDRTPGRSLGFSIQRASDGLSYDFANSDFRANPTNLVSALTAIAVPAVFASRYTATLASTPVGTFANGEYVVTCHDIAAANAVDGDAAILTMYGGSDAVVFPTGAGADPWGAVLSGYPAGQAGYILAHNLDEPVSAPKVLGPDGLDAVSVAEPTIAADGSMSAWNFRQLLRWVVMRLARGTRTPGALTVHQLDGDVATVQALADDGQGNEAIGVPT